MYVSLIVTFLLILGITIFALQNGMPLKVKFFVWEYDTSLVAVVFGSSLIGFIIGFIFTLPGVIRKHFRERKLTRQVHELEKKSQELEGHSVEKGEVEEIAVDPHTETP